MRTHIRNKSDAIQLLQSWGDYVKEIAQQCKYMDKLRFDTIHEKIPLIAAAFDSHDQLCTTTTRMISDILCTMG
jgi:hypothetical protein